MLLLCCATGCDKVTSAVGTGISFDPATYIFASVNVGSEATKELMLRNVGYKNATVTSLTFAQGSNPAFTLAHDWNLPRVMPPGDLAPVKVTYRPTQAGAANAVLQAQSTVGTAGAVVSNLPPAPRIEVVPTTVGFGTVLTGDTSTREVTVRNIGTAALNIQSIELGAGSDPAFSLAHPNGAAPYTLGVLHTRKFFARLTPNRTGQFTGTVEVKSNDVNKPAVKVELSSRDIYPEINVYPTGLYFRDVRLGESKLLAVGVSNSGYSDLVIKCSFDESSSSDFTLESPANPPVIAPNQAMDVMVKFTPSCNGAAAGTLKISHNDPNGSKPNPYLITLRTNSLPSINLSPFNVAFYGVTQGDTSEQEIVVSNGGFCPLSVSTIAFGSGETHADITLSGLPGLPANLTPGGSFVFKLVYNKNTPGDAIATAYLSSNDPDPSKNPFPLLISATGGINNMPPSAVIRCTNCVSGGDRILGNLPQTVQLDGTQSTDPDSDLLTYFWSFTSLPAQSQTVFNDPSAAKPTFEADKNGAYQISLIVTDTYFQTSPRVTFSIIVN